MIIKLYHIRRELPNEFSYRLQNTGVNINAYAAKLNRNNPIKENESNGKTYIFDVDGVRIGTICLLVHYVQFHG